METINENVEYMLVELPQHNRKILVDINEIKSFKKLDEGKDNKKRDILLVMLEWEEIANSQPWQVIILKEDYNWFLSKKEVNNV